MAQRDYHTELASYFVIDAKNFIENARRSLSEVLDGENVASELERGFVAIHALKGASGLFKQWEIHEIADKLEKLLELAIQSEASNWQTQLESSQFALESLDCVEVLVQGIEGGASDSGDLLNAFQNRWNEAVPRFEHLGLESEVKENAMSEEQQTTTSNETEIDPEILECFLEEASGIIESIHANLSKVSADPEDNDAVRALARGFHTLKGSSGLAGLSRIQELANSQQEMLEAIADAAVTPDADIVSTVQDVVSQIESQLGGGAAEPALADEELDSELVAVFLEEAGGYLEEIEVKVAAMDSVPDSATVERFARLFHTIKGSAGVVGLSAASAIAMETNDRLEEVVGGAAIPEDFAHYLASQIAAIKAAVGITDTAIGGVSAEDEAQSLADDQENMEFFAQDAGENLETFAAAVLAFEKDTSNFSYVDEMLRSVHTIKGASTLVGLREMVHNAGALEDLLQRMTNEKYTSLAAESLVDVLLDSADTLGAILSRASGAAFNEEHAQRDLSHMIAKVEEAAEGRNAQVLDTAAPDLDAADVEDLQAVQDAIDAVQESVVEELEKPQAVAASDAEEKARAASKAPTDASEKQIIRVDAERLNRLMNLVGELIICRTRLSSRVGDLSGIREELSARKDRLLELVSDFQMKHEFGQSLNKIGNRMAVQLGEVEESGFSELEFDRYDDFNILSRGLIEITSDVSEIMSQLDSFFYDVGEEAGNVAKVSSSMQYEVTQIRMVPASTLFDRLRRPVRDAARQEGKNVELTCIGSETELDKAIIDDLFKPFLHLVRNSVSHGIEAPDAREGGGKSAAGTILLKAFQEGNSVVIEVQDDGQGVDYAAIRRRGVELGFVGRDERPSDEELLALIFRPGFSTRSEVSEVSGRGIGMDAVANAISSLNGSISVQSVPGSGTKVSVRLPLTLAINQALIVSVSDDTFAIPLNYVEEAVVVEDRDIEVVSNSEVVRIRGAVVPLVRLAESFRVERSKTGDASKTAVIVTVENRRVALLVDRVLRRQEIVVKSSGGFLRDLGHIAGGTTGGDGNVYFIVDVPNLIGRENSREFAAGNDGGEVVPVQEVKKERSGEWLLVVDDSISVRKVASKLLQSAGYQVDLAVDGLHALEFLRENNYKAVITDLEMPQMHGYELIAEVRRNEDTRNLPVVVISSRSGQKHVQKALDLGADAYLGKPFTQNDLLSTLGKVVSKRSVSLA